MEQTVIVRQVFEDGTAQVMHIRESACSGDCHKCAGCGAVKETMLLRAENPIHAKPGDKVILTSQSKSVLGAAALVYLLPVVLFLTGYLLGAQLLNQGALMGGAGFLTGIGVIAAYDRLVLKKQTSIYTITGYSSSVPLNSRTKGDNELD